MKINQCIMTNSTCYLDAGRVDKHYGIVVHSTGVNQTAVARYVQPSEDDEHYDEIIAELGKNKYGNDWNHNKVYKGVHFFIGKNAKGEVSVWQVLPYENIAWGVAKGSVGSFNDNPPYFQFEMCEDGLDNEEYFNEVMKAAQELCAYLCTKYGFDPQAKIVSHYEAWQQGYGNQHVDPNNWLSKFGKDMNWFRDEVEKIMNTGTECFNRGDKVKLLSDYNINGVKLADWVTDGRPLYVVSSDPERTAVTVNADLSGITAVMRTCDVAYYDDPDDDQNGGDDQDQDNNGDDDGSDWDSMTHLERIASLFELLSDEFQALADEQKRNI